MANLETLVAVEEIKNLKARYFRFVDTRAWEQLASLFVPEIEVELDTPEGPVRVRGAGRFIEIISRGLAGCTSVHHGHMPEIEIDLPDRAMGIWAMEDRLEWAASGKVPARRLHGFGYYHETYRRLSGQTGDSPSMYSQWRIETLKLTRLRIEVSG